MLEIKINESEGSAKIVVVREQPETDTMKAVLEELKEI